MYKQLEDFSLDEVIEKMMEGIENSQHEVFSIAEAARNEYEATKEDLEEIREQTIEVIEKVDQLEKDDREARQHLMEVSNDISNYSEVDIKEAYENAKDTQLELSLLREKEKRLRQKRDDLERRLKKLEGTVDKAENLISQIGIIKNYLTDDLQELGSQFKELKQKEHMGIQIIKAQEKERKRVAREIHDGPAQLLANVVFKLEYFDKVVEKDVEEAKKEVKDLKSSVKKSLQDVRKIIFDLRPMSLDDLGLVPALKKYIEDFQEKTGLEIEFKILANKTELKSSFEVAIYRIIQEALNNAHQHAKTNTVDVKLELRPKIANVVIKDYGQGFDVEEALEDSAQQESFGLFSMKERAELLGGSVNFVSQAKEGTKVILEIPLKT
ncbi:sensor histidine kinase [Halanaerobacter jeridensis]|uniref:histidine kinase n=1 Tax=Halanaerobacter jeridensis TaxID=706427 RepID=A0A939BRB7_9FIRM|nr:sensor histidine kinase [Halanaerobacter jeridensis]MBM7557199.1 two-component system sensor histidine kinase DegS [Halanaerobacter jeridensis]